MLEPGMLVECVDDQTRPYSNIEYGWPVRGNVYTIREVYFHPAAVGVLLEEILRPDLLDPFGHEVGFRADRFRPIRKPSIEVFRRAVKDITEDVDA